jgi:16S rRNA (cytosine967-C5)-methyltransferase
MKPVTRELALRIIAASSTKKAYSSQLLSKAAHRRDINYPLLQRLVKGTLQWRSRLETLLEEVSKEARVKLDAKTHRLALVAGYQFMFLKDVPKPLVIAESVALAPKDRSGLALRKVLSVLANRDFSKIDDSVSLETAEAAAAHFSHPVWVVKRWDQQIGLEETKKLCAANNRPWPVAIRANTLRLSPAELRQRLQREGLKLSPGHFLEESFRVEALPRRVRLTDLDAHHLGLFQVQDESGSLVGYLCTVNPGDTVIDLCAAPGGKATHLAALMENRGRILALDINAARLETVRRNAKRLGVGIIKTKAADAKKFRPKEPADCVLLDAPCSGLGVLGRKADIRWLKNEKQLAELTALQAELLEAAAGMVKPTGRLVYSTCTLLREENEDQVLNFLKQHPEFKILVPPSSFPKSLVTKEGFVASWPHRHGIGGMFAAVLIKVKA